MKDPLKIADVLQQFQHPLDMPTRPRTLYEDFIYHKDQTLGIDFEDKLFIYITLLIFAWICNTGIVVQLQFKKDVQITKLILYSVLIPISLFMILIPILMYFEIWANYWALVMAVIASNFFTYFVTKRAVIKKERLVKFAIKLNEVKADLVKLIDKNGADDKTGQLKDLRKELDEFGPKYYNGI